MARRFVVVPPGALALRLSIIPLRYASRRVDFAGIDKGALLRTVNQAMVDAVPFNAALLLRAVDCGPGEATMVLPWRAEIVGNAETGVLHGGAITALMDATCGLAVFMKLEAPTRIATLDLRIDYLKPATTRLDVRCHAECYKLTRQVAFVRGLAFHDDPADAIASAAGTFMIFDENRTPVGQALEKKK